MQKSVDSAVKKILGEANRIDILINNAGRWVGGWAGVCVGGWVRGHALPLPLAVPSFAAADSFHRSTEDGTWLGGSAASARARHIPAATGRSILPLIRCTAGACPPACPHPAPPLLHRAVAAPRRTLQA